MELVFDVVSAGVGVVQFGHFEHHFVGMYQL